MTMTQTIPVDWPARVARAARVARVAKDEDAIRTLETEVLVLLRRNDPMHLRDRGMDAAKRQAFYADQVAELIRRAA